MAKLPGQFIYKGRTVSFPTDGSVSSGDVATLDASGQATAMVGDGTSNAIGVVSDQVPDDAEAGDNIPLHLTGVVVTAVPAAAAPADTVANGKYDVLSDEGGAFKQHDSSDATLPDGYAAVHLG